MINKEGLEIYGTRQQKRNGKIKRKKEQKKNGNYSA